MLIYGFQMLDLEISSWVEIWQIRKVRNGRLWQIFWSQFSPSEHGDRWCWSLKKDGGLIWSGSYPQRSKFFTWELSCSSISNLDVLETKSPWISISRARCPSCMRNKKTQIHLFSSCPFTNDFSGALTYLSWREFHMHRWHLLPVLYFAWSPLQRWQKKALSRNFMRAFQWLECNNHVFNNEQQDSLSFMDSITILVLSWNKLKNLFCNYNLSTLISQWPSLL